MSRSERTRCTFTMAALPAPPPQVFPLLCPVREHDWVPGWQAELLWSRSGLAEEGAVFQTPGEPGLPWTWHIVQHDRASGAIRFSVVAPDSHLLDLRILLSGGEAGSDLHWAYDLVPLTPRGAGLATAFAASFPTKMDRLERQLRHWLATGTMLAEGPA